MVRTAIPSVSKNLESHQVDWHEQKEEWASCHTFVPSMLWRLVNSKFAVNHIFSLIRERSYAYLR
jgi:hypothetical protein